MKFRIKETNNYFEKYEKKNKTKQIKLNINLD